MKAPSSIDLLQAAAYALISDRCRSSYIHDIRGGLQALTGAVELLVRAATNPGHSALAEKAAGIARSAMLNHEKSLMELLDRILPRQESPIIVNVGELVSEVLRFFRNDAASNSITLRWEGSQDLTVLAEVHKFRLLFLGLSITLTDGLDAGTIVDVRVTRSGPNALIEFSPVIPCVTVRTPEELWDTAGHLISPPELLVALAQAWASANGGSLDMRADSHTAKGMRLFYPVFPA
ncbi:MAG: hypothetical protein ABJC66_16055 [Gammaproteobacteria bacterium]